MSDGPKIQRVEIRDGWVYVDGVRTRPAQPESALSARNREAAQRGANRKGRGKR